MTETKHKRKPRKYTDKFKQKLVNLYHSGKRRCDICREYALCPHLPCKCHPVKGLAGSLAFAVCENCIAGWFWICYNLL